MLYAYAPAGDVAHWRQELDGSLPRAGVEAPPLPAGARPQREPLRPRRTEVRGMSTRTVGIILNGVTGRMGTNQHLLRSIVPIIRQGGVRAGDATIMPEPLLVGRDPAEAGGPGPERPASPGGPPTSTRRSPIRGWPSTSTPRPRCSAPPP